MKHLLIAGCGDLGVRLAGRLDADWAVSGLRRRVEPLPDTIRAVCADLSDPGSLSAAAGEWDAVVYQATPDERSESGYRSAYVDGLANLFDVISARRLIFVSSTAVFGQDDGEWVDEDSPTEPPRFNGRILLEAEALAARCSSEAAVVRFSGIYGPGRDFLVRKVAAGDAQCRAEPPQWTNRIHADDCAAVLAHLLTLDRPAPLYCASDLRPSPRCEVLDWLARRLEVPPPERAESEGGQGKRVNSERLRATGFEFTYPDYRSGYEEMLK